MNTLMRLIVNWIEISVVESENECSTYIDVLSSGRFSPLGLEYISIYRIHIPIYMPRILTVSGILENLIDSSHCFLICLLY